MSTSGKHGKRHQVTFRITLRAKERLDEVAALFNLRPSKYVKAVLYRDLGLYDEPIDLRSQRW